MTPGLLWLVLGLAGLTTALLVLAAGARARERSYIARARLAAAEPAAQYMPRRLPPTWRPWLLAPAAMVLAIVLNGWIHSEPIGLGGALCWALGALGGVCLWQATARRRRKQAIALAFPDLVSHLALQLQAGATPLLAFSSSLAVVHGPLGLELGNLVADLKLAPLDAALLRFAQQTDDPDIWAFCQHVVQQQRSGMSLAAIFAAEERHAVAMQQQRGRERISRAGAALSAVLVILLVNGAAMWALPMALSFIRYLSSTN